MEQALALLILVATCSAYIESLGAEVGSSGASLPFHGKVAFMCGKPAVHWSNGAWVRDDSQGCLESMEDIRTYCRRVYPSAKVSNVEPSPEEETVSGWCKFQENSCGSRGHTEHRVRPFLCLAGQYQSPALLVPEHCSFGHRTDDPRTGCRPTEHWNNTAQKQCSKRSNQLAASTHVQSFGLLLPCQESKHAGWFAGVEYVCCPNDNVKAPITPAKGHVVHDVPRKGVPPRIDSNDNRQLDAYHRYLRYPDDDDLAEHDRYMDAKRELRSMLGRRERQLQIELSRAEERIRESMGREPESAKKLMEEVEARFKRTAKAIAAEEQSELRQLDDVHQQRIQARFNRRKERARETFEYMLQEQVPQESRISRALQRLIRLEMKDKVHTINHLEHLRVADPSRAAKILTEVRQKLRALSTQIQDALALLDKYTKGKPFEAKIKADIKSFMKSYDDVTESEKIILTKPVVVDEQKDEDKFQTLVQQYHQQNMAVYHHVKEGLKDELHVEPVHDEHDRGHREHGQHVKHHGKKKQLHVVPGQGHAPNHAKGNRLTATHHHSGHHSDSSYNVGTVVAVCAGSVTVFLLILVVVLAVRRRANYLAAGGAARFGGRGYHMSVVDQEPSTPEEKHLHSMQHNGYENPTYKYFEVNPTYINNNVVQNEATK